MDVKKIREQVSYGFLALQSVQGVFGLGMTGLLFSYAIGLIVLSFNQPLEITIATTILAGLLWKVLSDRRRSEGFQVPVGAGESPEGIAKRIERIQNQAVFQPSGVLSSNFTEGFADAEASTQNQAGSVTTATTPNTTGTPAPTNAPTATNQLAAALPTAAATAAAAPSTVPQQPAQTAGFADKATDGMFKLGSIPADTVGGAHIDVGTTLMNALNALKPDQVKAMTDDTRKLMETQKSLMSMLASMKPMLADGKELMTTVTEMFGKGP